MAHSRSLKSRMSSAKPAGSDAAAARPSNQLSQDLDLLRKLNSGEDAELKAFASSLRSRSQTQVRANDERCLRALWVRWQRPPPMRWRALCSRTTAGPAATSFLSSAQLPHLRALPLSFHAPAGTKILKEEADFVRSNPDAAALSARAARVTSVDRKSLAFDSESTTCSI